MKINPLDNKFRGEVTQLCSGKYNVHKEGTSAGASDFTVILVLHFSQSAVGDDHVPVFEIHLSYDKIFPPRRLGEKKRFFL